MVICLQRGADLHMAQLMPLPLTVSCFSKIQIGVTFLVPAHLGSPGQGPLNVCVCVCVCMCQQRNKQKSMDRYRHYKQEHSPTNLASANIFILHLTQCEIQQAPFLVGV